MTGLSPIDLELLAEISLTSIADLLNHGANVNARNEENKTPLVLAVERGDTDTVKLLIERGAITTLTVNGESLVFIAAKNGYNDIYEILLALARTREAKQRQTAKQAFNHLDINLLAETELTKIAELLERGAHIDAHQANKKTPLILAIERGDAEVMRFLINHGANVNDYNALIAAIRNGRADMVAILLDNGANVNALTSKGNTPVFYAIEYRQPEILQLLIQRHADLKITNEKQQTPRLLAMATNQDDMVDMIDQQFFNVIAGTIEQHFADLKNIGEALDSPAERYRNSFFPAVLNNEQQDTPPQKDNYQEANNDRGFNP